MALRIEAAVLADSVEVDGTDSTASTSIFTVDGDGGYLNVLFVNGATGPGTEPYWTLRGKHNTADFYQRIGDSIPASTANSAESSWQTRVEAGDYYVNYGSAGVTRTDSVFFSASFMPSAIAGAR